MKYCPECKAEYSDDQAICLRDASVLLDKGTTSREYAPDPFIGRTIAEKYCIERLIGRGGMGAVYEGRHLLLERPVAIKVLHKNMSADERAAARFIREAKATAKIEHANAVTIHDFGVLQDGSAYLIMEFIRGLSLRQHITNKGKIELEQAVNVAVQICSVVEAAHQQGIIHRDLKPENVMLKESIDGSVIVKVVDFGLAKLVSGDGVAHLTQTGEVLGTPHYMAPEFYEGEQVDKRADIYAIGVMLYEMLTGEVPFSGTVQSIIGGHLFKDPKPLFETNPSIHPQINDVAQYALKKKRDERFGSALEFAQKLKFALKQVQGDSGPLPVKTPARAATNSAAASMPASAPLIAPPVAAPGNEVKEAHFSPAQDKQPPRAKSGRKAKTDPYRNAVSTQELEREGGTDNLSQEEPQDSSGLLKRDTGDVTYNTVSIPVQEVAPVGESAESDQQVSKAYSTQRFDKQPEPEIEQEETETFIEMIASMKRELAIGSVIVTLLAIALVVFIIYRSQQSTIRVKPLPDAPAQTQSRLSPVLTPDLGLYERKLL
jgi:eukaryotic-like serine/threonine-protein kinase